VAGGSALVNSLCIGDICVANCNACCAVHADPDARSGARLRRSRTQRLGRARELTIWSVSHHHIGTRPYPACTAQISFRNRWFRVSWQITCVSAPVECGPAPPQRHVAMCASSSVRCCVLARSHRRLVPGARRVAASRARPCNCVSLAIMNSWRHLNTRDGSSSLLTRASIPLLTRSSRWAVRPRAGCILVPAVLVAVAAQHGVDIVAGGRAPRAFTVTIFARSYVVFFCFERPHPACLGLTMLPRQARQAGTLKTARDFLRFVVFDA
jgi:hypothetical protein